MPLYEVVGSREEKQKLHASNETERITNFNDRQEYMSLCGPRQEESSEYQQPQQCGRNNMKSAENKEGVSEYHCNHVLKNELKQTKVCLCALSLLIVVLFLITASSLALAAYCYSSSTRSGNNLEYQLNMINSEVVSHKTFINNLESQLSAKVTFQRTFINNLESQVTNINTEVTSQRTSITTLNSRLNELDSDVSIVNGSVTSLQSQLTRILTNYSSFQIIITSQPSKNAWYTCCVCTQSTSIFHSI